MGVINVTPDSFSDGGLYLERDAAIAHGRELAAAGATILDVGGESTRPGADRLDEAEEARRAIPVIRALASEGYVMSIDTMRARVAAAAVDAGARYLNDVSGGLADPDMARVAAESGLPYVAMHWRGHSADMYARAQYDDVVAEVRDELLGRVDTLVAAGVAPASIIIDPGLGFAKTFEHNWTLLAHIDELNHLGHRLLVGTSRKGFLGAVGRDGAEPRPATERDIVTAATSLHLARAGVWGIRVHNVEATVDALDVTEAIARAL